MSKRQLVSGMFGIIACALALGLWVAVEHAVTVPGASDLMVPMAVAGVFATAFVLMVILASSLRAVLIWSVIISALALSVAQSMVLVIGAVVATGLLVLSGRDIHGEINSRTEFHIAQSVRAGFGWLVLATTILVSTLYYTLLIQHDAASLALSNSLRSVASSSIIRTMMPAPIAAQNTKDKDDGKNGEVTVDDFIAYMVGKQIAQSGGASSTQIGSSISFMEQYASTLQERLGDMIDVRSGIGAQIMKSLPVSLTKKDASEVPQNNSDVQNISTKINAQIIASSRAQLAEQLGIPLTGKEPVADVFVQFAQQWLQNYTEKSVLPAGYKFSTALAGVMAVFLFITISWLGSLLRFAVIPVSGITFWILRKVGLVSIVVVKVDQETLV